MKVLFVCDSQEGLSSLAESISRRALWRRGHGSHILVDSARLSNSLPPDQENRLEVLAAGHGLSFTKKSRGFVQSDFIEADMIVTLTASATKLVAEMQSEQGTSAKLLEFPEVPYLTHPSNSAEVAASSAEDLYIWVNVAMESLIESQVLALPSGFDDQPLESTAGFTHIQPAFAG